MDPVKDVISQMIGIAPAALLVFSLDYENTANVGDYYFADSEGVYLCGYYANTLSDRQYMFVLRANGTYYDTLITL